MTPFRKFLSSFEEYLPGEQPQEGGFTKLNTNECPYPPSPAVAEAIRAELPRLNLYPDPLSTRLRDAAGKVFGFPPEAVIAGNGSDDLITIAMRCLVEKGVRVGAFPYPTYNLYDVVTAMQEGMFVPVTARDPDEAIRFVKREKIDVLFTSNPNNPTAEFHGADFYRSLIEKTGVFLILDCAYVDFAGENCDALARESDRVLVMRSLSKSYSLAGMRVGIGLAAPRVIRELMKVKDSYNLDRLAIAGASAALSDRGYHEECVRKVCETRATLFEGLSRLGLSPRPSRANFVFFENPQGRRIYEELKSKRILVRYFHGKGCDNAVRVSVGLPDEIAALLRELGSVRR